MLDKNGHLIADLTRRHFAKALNVWPLSGEQDLLEMLRAYWPIDRMPSQLQAFESLADELISQVLISFDESGM